MKRKILIASFLILLIFSFTSSFGKTNIIFSKDILKTKVLSKNIFTDSEVLNSTIFEINSDLDIKDYFLYSLCQTKSDFLGKKEKRYYFKISFTNKNCHSEDIYLKNKKNIIINSNARINIVKYSQIFSLITDYKDNDLIKFRRIINENIKKYSLFKDGNELNSIENYDFFIKNRLYKEFMYIRNILDDILSSREKKYISPVRGYKIPFNNRSKLPNAPREHRKLYTDGIHHGWDIDAPLNSPVLALDDGIIVRVVSGFSYSDLSKIKFSPGLSYEEKIINLDILRGNQVWLKTSKGDVVFYSHLGEVYDGIKKGVFVKKGHILGTIGVSGIPDKKYLDYHLHFAIQKNPYNRVRAGKYSNLDYMKWDWYFKGEGIKYVLGNQREIFQ